MTLLENKKQKIAHLEQWKEVLKGTLTLFCLPGIWHLNLMYSFKERCRVLDAILVKCGFNQWTVGRKIVVFMFISIQFCDIVYYVQDRAEMPKDVLGLAHNSFSLSFNL